MAVATFLVLLSALFSYAVAEAQPECTGPSPVCLNIVDEAITIEDAWSAYGVATVELKSTKYRKVFAAVLEARNLQYQQCMFRINDHFDGETASPTTDKLCRRALKESEERDAIDFYNDRFFYGLLVDVLHSVTVTLLKLSQEGGNCHGKQCSYLISETFPKIFEKKTEDNQQALKRILEELVDDEDKAEEEEVEKKTNVLMTLLNGLVAEKAV